MSCCDTGVYFERIQMYEFHVFNKNLSTAHYFQSLQRHSTAIMLKQDDRGRTEHHLVMLQTQHQT